MSSLQLGPYSFEIIDSNKFDKVWSLCTSLSKQMSYPSFFCSGDWLAAVSAVVEGSSRQLVVVVKQKNVIKAILPLIERSNFLGGKDCFFLGGEFYPDPVGIITSSEDREAVLHNLQVYLFNMPGWDRIFIDYILKDEIDAWCTSMVTLSTEPYMLLPEDFNDLLGTFKKKKRYNLNAMVKKAEHAGCNFYKSIDNKTNSDYLEGLYRLHAMRAEERNIKSTFEGDNVKALHRKLVGSVHTRFYSLDLEGRPLAILYGFEFEGRFFYYQIAHDPSAANLSPGSVLLFYVIEECCKNRIKEFNFLQGGESYKSIWTKDSRVLYSAQLRNNTWRAFLLNIYDMTKYFLKKVTRRNDSKKN